MFKSSKWKIDRNTNRTKSLFKLHFRITQVPVLVGDALLVSVIPKDVGKPTNKLEKGVVEDGSCCWEKPVYETVRFVKDPKSGKLGHKIYYFIVSTGNQKSNVVGEVSIDFAEYAESSKPSAVSLPFKNPQCTAVLHVTIQRMHEHAEPRSFMEIEDVTVKSKNSLGDVEFDEKEISPDQGTPLARTASENVDLIVNYGVSSASELFSSSDCYSELNTSRELAQNKDQGHTSLQSSPICDSLTRNPVIKRLQQQQSECSVNFYGISTNSSTIHLQDSVQNQKHISAAEVEIERLKNELAVLARQAEFSGLELQTLRKQIVKESKRGNEIARELNELKAAQKHIDMVKAKYRGVRDPLVLIEELRQELQNERNLNANLKFQLEKTQESNTELILAVQDLDEMLEQKNIDLPNLSLKSPSYELAAETPELTCKCYIQKDDEQKALEELVNMHGDFKDASIFEQKNVIDIYQELEICRRDRDNMEMQMEQLALDYEILKQENQDVAYKLEQSQLQEQLKVQYECSYTSINELEGQIEGLENELMKQNNRCADSLAKICELQFDVTFLEDELEKQAQGFEADIESVMSAKVEQEQRAILAEEALRATKKHNASTAERLLIDIKRVFSQMGTALDEKEKLSKKFINEAAELHQEKIHLEISLRKSMDDLILIKQDYENKIVGLSNQVISSTHQVGEMKAEADEKINKLEAQVLREKEICQDLSQEMLDLRDEIQRLTEVNNVILKENTMLKADLEEANAYTDEAEMALIGRNVELSELEDTIALITEKAYNSVRDLDITKSILQEKEILWARVVSEMEDLKARYIILEQTSSEDKSEIENLHRQILQLKRVVEDKEDALSTANQKLEEINVHIAITKQTKNEAACLIEKIQALEGQITLSEKYLEATVDSFLGKEKDLMEKIKELVSKAEELNSNQNDLETVVPESDQRSLDTIMGEMEKLKERNMYMEMELKEMQGRYSEISLKFAEVEGERQKLMMSLRYLKSSRRH